MKNLIIKKLIVILLFSINAKTLKEKLDRCTLPLNSFNPLASEKIPIVIKRQLINIEYFYEDVRFINSIKGQSILKSVKEIEVFPLI